MEVGAPSRTENCVVEVGMGHQIYGSSIDDITLRGRAREELVSKTSQFKETPGSPVTDL